MNNLKPFIQNQIEAQAPLDGADPLRNLRWTHFTQNRSPQRHKLKITAFHTKRRAYYTLNSLVRNRVQYLHRNSPEI